MDRLRTPSLLPLRQSELRALVWLLGEPGVRLALPPAARVLPARIRRDIRDGGTLRGLHLLPVQLRTARKAPILPPAFEPVSWVQHRIGCRSSRRAASHRIRLASNLRRHSSPVSTWRAATMRP